MRPTVDRSTLQRNQRGSAASLCTLRTKTICSPRVVVVNNVLPVCPETNAYISLNSAIGIVAVVVPGSLYLLNSRQDHVQHNDHEGQKQLHTSLTHVEKSKKAGTGGKLHGIDELVTTKAEDVDHHLPADALNHPVNREKVRANLRKQRRIGPAKCRWMVNCLQADLVTDREDDEIEAPDEACRSTQKRSRLKKGA